MATFEIFRDKLSAQAKEMGFTDYEMYYSAGNSFSVRVFKGEIAEYKDTSTEGVGFRGTYNGKMGYAYTEKLDTDLVTPLLQNAIGNAGIIEEEEVEQLYPGDKHYQQVDTYNPTLSDVSSEQKINWALEMEKYGLSLDPRVKMIDYCTILTAENATAIANSYGLDVAQKNNMAIAYLIARVEENGENKSAMEFWAGRDFSEFDYKTLVSKTVNTALSYLGAESIPSGQYPVLFNDETARDLFNVFSSVFVAELCQKGFSLLSKSKVGEVIAAPFITLRDDGICDLSLNSSAFDAEGVASQNKAIIENGVLKTLLYNTKSAAKDGVKSTGNASKGGFGGTINTSIMNFYLSPGEKRYDELVSGMDKGVIITDLAGLHSGANTISGDFSFSAEGYLVEGGKIVKPVEQITVAGNFYDLLKNIEQVGSDLRFSYGGVGMPSVLVSGLSIAGL